MCSRGGIDQLSRDPYPVGGLANASFQDIAHAKLAPDLLHVDRASLVGEVRVPRDDEKRLELRQRRDDVVDHSIGEEVLLGIGAQVDKGQNGDRGPSGSVRILANEWGWSSP